MQLGSARRSVFSNDEERKKFLSGMLENTARIMQSNIGLQHAENFHEFCRLLARFKSAYQLTDLMECQQFDDWMALVADFSVRAFQSWEARPL